MLQIGELIESHTKLFNLINEVVSCIQTRDETLVILRKERNYSKSEINNINNDENTQKKQSIKQSPQYIEPKPTFVSTLLSNKTVLELKNELTWIQAWQSFCLNLYMVPSSTVLKMFELKLRRKLKRVKLYWEDLCRYDQEKKQINQACYYLNNVITETEKHIQYCQKKHIKKLLSYFPISTKEDSSTFLRWIEIYSVNGYRKKVEDFSNNDLRNIGTSLGFLAHLTSLIAHYLNIALLQKICLCSSRSTLQENEAPLKLRTWEFQISPKPLSVHKTIKSDETSNEMKHHSYYLIYRCFEGLFIPVIFVPCQRKYSRGPCVKELNWNEWASLCDNTSNECQRVTLKCSDINTLIKKRLSKKAAGRHFFLVTSSQLVLMECLPQVGRNLSAVHSIPRAPLHPLAASSVRPNYFTMTQQNSAFDECEFSENSTSSQDPFMSTLSLLRLSTKPQASSLKEDQTQSNVFPLFLNPSMSDRTRFLQALSMLKVSIHQLAWENDNKHMDDYTRLEGLTEIFGFVEYTDPILAFNFNSADAPINQRTYAFMDNVSLLHPVVFAASVLCNEKAKRI